MNKEKLMQLISEAIDKGAYIDVHVGQFNENEGWRNHAKEEAEKFITQFQEAIGCEEVKQDSSDVADNLEVKKDKIRAVFSYVPVMEEDINFYEEGDEGIA